MRRNTDMNGLKFVALVGGWLFAGAAAAAELASPSPEGAALYTSNIAKNQIIQNGILISKSSI